MNNRLWSSTNFPLNLIILFIVNKLSLEYAMKVIFGPFLYLIVYMYY